MVFDGKHLTPFDEQLLVELREAESVPLEPDGDSPSPSSSPSPGRPRRDRQIVAVVMAAFVVMVVLAGVLATRSTGHGGDTDVLPAPDADQSVAEQHVLTALAQTTSAGTFDLEYRLSETLAATPSPSTCSQVYDSPVFVEPSGASASKSQYVGSSCVLGPREAITVTGKGTINVSPKAMVVSAELSSGLSVSVRLAGDMVWESGGADYGLVPNGGTSGSGQPLSGFASLVEGSLGPREGALAMTRMASPNAYLAIEQATVTGAQQVGTGTVDGVAVTNYQVDVDLHRLVDSPGLSADELTTLHDALAVLDQQGYAGTSDTVSVDADGLIRAVTAVASFEDGATVTYAATYSNFGCAGTVQMPGRSAESTSSGPCPAAGPADPSTTTSTTAPTSTTTAPSSSDPGSTFPTTTLPDPSSSDPTSTVTTSVPTSGDPTTTAGSVVP